MGQLARFDTRGLATGERLAGWGEFISSGPGRLQTQPCGDVPFSGSLAMATIGRLRVFRVRATPHRLERLAGRVSGPEAVRIVIQVHGQAVLSQGGQDVVLEPGCWAAWSTNRAHVINNLTEVEQFGLLIPMSHIGMKVADIVQQAGNRLGDRPGIGKLLPNHIEQLFDQIETIDQSLHGELSDIVAHLVRLSLVEYRTAKVKTSMRETMRSRVADYVRHNLRDPEISLDRIAEHFGCSKRNIHKVFSASGTTLSQFLWIERLDRCREALASPELAARSITEIAFSWGFNSSTHFSKAFKSRYGSAPGSWRTQAIAGAMPVREAPAANP